MTSILCEETKVQLGSTDFSHPNGICCARRKGTTNRIVLCNFNPCHQCRYKQDLTAGFAELGTKTLQFGRKKWVLESLVVFADV